MIKKESERWTIWNDNEDNEEKDSWMIERKW